MQGWSKRRLIEITEKIGSGATPRGGQEAYKETGISLFRSLNVYDGVFKEKNLAFIDDDQANRLSNVVVREGDVLLNITGASIARCCAAPLELLPARVNQHVMIVRPKPACIDTNFLAYLLVSKQYKDALLNTGEKAGSTRQALTKTQIENFEVTIPKLPEQKRIVLIVDQAFEGIDRAIAHTKKNRTNAHKLFESYLNAVFTQKSNGWMKEKLHSVVEPSCSLSYGIVQPGNEYENGLPIVRPTDLITKTINLSSLKRIDPSLADSYKRTKLSGGELLLCVRGSTGVVGIAVDELKGANVTRGIVPIRFEQSVVVQAFGYYILISKMIQDQIKEKTYGTALMQINIRDLRNIALSFPGQEEQQILVKKLGQMENDTQRLENIYQQKLAALNELKQSILQKAFTGELTADTVNQTTKKAEKAIAA